MADLKAGIFRRKLEIALKRTHMDDSPFQNLPAHRSMEEILAHPRFAVARDELVRAMLALYEHDPHLNRLLLDAGRNVLFVVIMCLHARYDEADRATWPTLGLVTRSAAAQGVASARRIHGLVSQFIQAGFLEPRASPRDRRIRIVTPTAKMTAQDQDWLVSHYLPLQVLFPNPGYPRIMGRDPEFQRAQRLVASSFFALGASILADHPIVMQFMSREAGIMVLLKLLQRVRAESLAPAGDARAQEKISYSDIGARFGVSRTHVRKILQEAESQGLMRLTKDRDPFVELAPELVTAFDRFLAAGMSGHDLIYKLALGSAA
jgi:DNA-binding MarR family transcriptional regulator